MTLSEYYHACAIPKPGQRLKAIGKGLVARLRARKTRKDRTAFASAAELVAARDGYCRYGADVHPYCRSKCAGPSDPAHYGDQRRFKTRGQAPAIRHTTEGMLALCRRHHADYDEGRLKIVARSSRGCDGPLVYPA